MRIRIRCHWGPEFNGLKPITYTQWCGSQHLSADGWVSKDYEVEVSPIGRPTQKSCNDAARKAACVAFSIDYPDEELYRRRMLHYQHEIEVALPGFNSWQHKAFERAKKQYERCKS